MPPEQPWDLFFSYSHADQDSVESIARRLRASGRRVFLDKWYLTPGAPWPQELERHLANCRSAAIFVGPNGLGRWQYPEYYLAIDRQVREPAFRVIPVLLPGADPPLGFLGLYTWVDLRAGIDDAALARLLAATAEAQVDSPQDEPVRTAARDLACPYRGLRAFREEDAAFFCGRDEFINRLATASSERSFVVVVGASGSGKSSVVRAGLVPRLRRRPGGVTWDVSAMVPGDRPFYALAALLVPLLEPALSEIDRLRQTAGLAADMQSGGLQVRDVVARALQRQPGTDRMLLVVDQWEELYTLTKDTAARRRFIDSLVEATGDTERLTVVATLRSDFFGEILNDRPLFDRLGGEPVTVSRMSAAELRRVIEEPADKVGLRFEAGLVGRLLEATQGETESLPLLEFVLAELWEQRTADGSLTHSAYEAMEQLSGAVAVHAQKTFDRLSPDDRVLARQVFLQVVRPGERPANADATPAPPTRRRTTFKDIGADKAAVVRRLADAHLLVTGRDDATGEEVIDLVHEALIKAWKTLRQWIQDEDEFLRWREQLRALMALSQSGPAGNAATSFLRGPVLKEAVARLGTRRSDLSVSEQRFIELNRDAAWRRWRPVGVGTAGALGMAVIGWISLGAQPGPGPFPEPLVPTVPPAQVVDPYSPAGARDIDVSGIVVPASPVSIPTVVHVVYRSAAENVSDDAIRLLIANVNRDLTAANGDLQQVPEAFKGRIGNAQLRLQLATKDAQGGATTGIVRVPSTRRADWTIDDVLKRSSLGGSDAWPADRFLNIWIASLPNNLLEVSSFPGGPPPLDGITLTTLVVRDPKHHRSLTHGVGHWLGLRHIWGDASNCDGTDYVADTPNQRAWNFGSPTFPHITCNNGPHGDMFMNFMDFSEVGRMFTQGQVLRMHAMLRKHRPLILKQQ